MSSSFGPDVQCSTPYGPLPLFVEPATPELRRDIGCLVALLDDRKRFDAALLEHGAIVFRGFPVCDTDDFAKVVDGFPVHAPGYAGGAALRGAIKGRVMEASRAGKDRYIKLHQEMSYLPNHPRMLAFFCHVAADSGGATIISDMRKVSNSLPSALMRAFADKGVRYKRNLLSPEANDARLNPSFGHNNWVANFGTEDRAEVERLCEQRGLKAEWLSDGSLDLVNERPGVIKHPDTGELLYFNQSHVQVFRRHAYDSEWPAAEAAYGSRPKVFDSTFGDGTPLCDGDLTLIHDALEDAMVAFAWMPGDVMFVENKLTAHGREPFTGTRDVQVALID